MTPNEVAKAIIDAAFRVHSELGAGLLEEAYQVCLTYELQRRNLHVLREVGMPVVYEGNALELGYRIDLLVEGSVIVELKSVAQIASIHKAQLLTYLKLSKISLGLLLNFNTPHLKDWIVRMINS